MIARRRPPSAHGGVSCWLYHLSTSQQRDWTCFQLAIVTSLDSGNELLGSALPFPLVTPTPPPVPLRLPQLPQPHSAVSPSSSVLGTTLSWPAREHGFLHSSICPVLPWIGVLCCIRSRVRVAPDSGWLPTRAATSANLAVKVALDPGL